MDAEKLIFTKRHRVVLPGPAPRGDGATVARQLDAVLLSQLDPGYVIDEAVKVIAWARELTGGHVKHNAYFIGCGQVLGRRPLSAAASAVTCLASA